MAIKDEFKEFLLKGNVMDMAVGIIIGAAFTAIVTSFVDDLIMPIIGMLTGGVDFSSLAVTVGSASLTYGNLITAIINFLLIALVIFWLVKGINKLRSGAEAAAGIEKEEEAEAPTCPFCKEEIKEGATVCPHCASKIEA